jgi:hypothetical protein
MHPKPTKNSLEQNPKRNLRKKNLTLDVIVEASQPVSVPPQELETVVVADVFKLDNSVRPLVLDRH